MFTEPRPQHQWLKRFVGSWTVSGSCDGPDGQTMQFSAVETVRAIGDLWIVGESVGTMPGGGEMVSLLTVGYDTTKDRFVGSWIGSPMDYLWTYTGWLENNDRTLVLEAEGPSMTEPGKTCLYRDINEFVSNDHRAFRSEVRSGDGSWSKMMTAEYKRRN